MMKRILLIWILLIILSLFSLYGSEQSTKNIIRIGVIKTVDTIHPYIASKLGYFDEEGISYKIYSFGTSPALAEAIAAGEIDVAYMSFIPAAVWISKGVPMRIVSGVTRGGDIVCFREKVSSGRIAVSKKGTMTETVYTTLIKDRLNFTPVYGIEPSDMPTALLITNDVEAVVTWEPFASIIEDNGGKCTFDAGEEWKRVYGKKYQRNVLVVSENVLKNKTLLNKIMHVHEKTTAFLNTTSSYDTIVNTMGISWFKKERVEYSTELDRISMEEMMQTAVKEGYLAKVMKYEDIVYT